MKTAILTSPHVLPSASIYDGCSTGRHNHDSDRWTNISGGKQCGEFAKALLSAIVHYRGKFYHVV